MNQTIYAPNVHLFAFQLREGLDLNFQPIKTEREWVKKTYQKILNHFPEFIPDFALREDIPQMRSFYLLKKSKKLHLLKPQKLSEKHQISQEIFVSPQQIADSYALTLDIRIPQKTGQDKIEIEDLKNFNPNNCLKTSTNLGQTILVTAFLDDYSQLETTAKECLKSLFDLSSSEKSPLLYRKGNLLNSPVFEYGNPRDLSPLGHVLILFFTDEANSERFNQCYWELPNLLLYYHKIVKAFEGSRLEYTEARQKLSKIETVLQPLDNHPSSINHRLLPTEIARLERKLKDILNIALQYTKNLRNLEFYNNTIAINIQNYKTVIAHLKTLSTDDLSFLESFAEIEGVTLQNQIQGDLNYLKQGTNLLEQGTNTIRGLIEIDRASSDRRLQNIILSVGSGISAGGIFTTSYGYLKPDNTLYSFSQSLIFSLAFAILVAVIVYLTMKER